MSWFIGYTGKNNPILGQYISSINLERIKEIKPENLTLIFGGKQENLLFNFYDDSTGWIVSGIPIYTKNDNLKFVNKNDFEKLFLNKELKLTDIDGHFAGIKWDKGKVTFFNDQLGLRDIYYLQFNSNFLFSTRMDWIAKFNKTNKIDFENFSTSWVLPHQISWGSIIKDIDKLKPGQIITISGNKLEKNDSPWQPNFEIESSSEEFLQALDNFIKLASLEDEKINLGLSGGIDSRVLLQLLFNKNTRDFGTHTFGTQLTADGRIAKKIVDDYKLDHRFFSVSFPEEDQLIKNLYKNISQLGLSTSIFETLNYPFYKQLDNLNYIIIDGAYGEIFRRAYLNRFLILGRKALLYKEAETIFSLLKRQKADIFNDGITSQIEYSTINQISNILDILPDPKLIGIENWLDTFFIKTKVANISGPSQTYLDNICRALMPFIQPSILNYGFSVNINEKKNGRLFLNVINEGKKLNKYPLVKDQIIYPFSSNIFFTRMYQKVKRRMGLIHSDNTKINLLSKLKNFAFNKINSSDVKNYDLYNYNKVSNLVTNFYNGNTTLADELIWWISFEIWRENYNIK